MHSALATPAQSTRITPQRDAPPLRASPSSHIAASVPQQQCVSNGPPSAHSHIPKATSITCDCSAHLSHAAITCGYHMRLSHAAITCDYHMRLSHAAITCGFHCSACMSHVGALHAYATYGCTARVRVLCMHVPYMGALHACAIYGCSDLHVYIVICGSSAYAYG